MDQGITLLKIYELWQVKKFTLIGPESSIKAVNGLSFFHGPWIYYFLLPFLLVGNWNPLVASYAFIILNLLALMILFATIKEHFNVRTAFIACLFFTLDIISIRFSQFFWNPNFLPFFSSLILYFWLKIIKRPKLNYFFLIGLILGLSLGCHYQTILLIISFIIYSILKRIPFKNLSIALFGFLLGLSPLIIFELKHNFYNSTVIYLVLKKGSQNGVKWPLPSYYFLSLLPFLFFLLAIFIERILRKNHFLGYLLIIIFVIFSLFKIIPKSKSGFTMPTDWNYLEIEKAAKIILKENSKNYNIANTLYGDTRDYALRYLLTIAKNPPLGVELYPQAKSLFVISRQDKEEVIKNPVWEISSFCPCKVVKIWKIQNNINLYLLLQRLQGENP